MDTPTMAETITTILSSYHAVTSQLMTDIASILTMISQQALLLIPLGVAFTGWGFGMLGRAIHKS